MGNLLRLFLILLVFLHPCCVQTCLLLVIFAIALLIVVVVLGA